MTSSHSDECSVSSQDAGRYKVVFNDCHGGFGLSAEAKKLGCSLSGNPLWNPNAIPRHDPVLVEVVEQLRARAQSPYASLCVAEVSGPYIIDEYDGWETVLEPGDIHWNDPASASEDTQRGNEPHQTQERDDE